jgi:hypothetical protein
MNECMNEIINQKMITSIYVCLIYLIDTGLMLLLSLYKVYIYGRFYLIQFNGNDLKQHRSTSSSFSQSSSLCDRCKCFLIYIYHSLHHLFSNRSFLQCFLFFIYSLCLFLHCLLRIISNDVYVGFDIGLSLLYACSFSSWFIATLLFIYSWFILILNSLKWNKRIFKPDDQNKDNNYQLSVPSSSSSSSSVNVSRVSIDMITAHNETLKQKTQFLYMVIKLSVLVSLSIVVSGITFSFVHSFIRSFIRSHSLIHSFTVCVSMSA